MKKSKKWWLIGAIALLAIVIFVIVGANSNGGDHTTALAERRHLTEQVRVAGRVEADIVADLGFEIAGTVKSVTAQVDAVVGAGAQLAALNLGTLPAELKSAQADLAIVRAESGNTAINFDAIEDKHDTLVESAYTTLLSEGLVAEPDSDGQTQTAPIISGRYTGPEGTYKIRLKDDDTSTTKYELLTFDLERTGPIDANETGPTKLGTHGLFVSFPDGLSDYRDTSWYVQIPNIKSSSYLANYNAYQEAVRERERALEEAEAELRSQTAGSSVSAARIAQAEAEVERIESQISEHILRAPFAGTVSAVSIDPGESVSAGAPAITLISRGELGVEVDLPEVDSVKVKVGDKAKITLDAFGETTVFDARVVTVNRSETIVDGVSVYETRLAFEQRDERIVSGMTAEVVITTNEQLDTLAVPVTAVKYRPNGETYVTIFDANNNLTDVDVEVGLRSSDGYIQILFGLDEGATVINE